MPFIRNSSSWAFAKQDSESLGAPMCQLIIKRSSTRRAQTFVRTVEGTLDDARIIFKGRRISSQSGVLRPAMSFDLA